MQICFMCVPAGPVSIFADNEYYFSLVTNQPTIFFAFVSQVNRAMEPSEQGNGAGGIMHGESTDREQLWHAWASRQPSSVKKDDPSMSCSCANNGIRSSEVAGAILTFCLTGSTAV